MINWFRKYRFKIYKEQLKKAFPKSLESDLNVVLNIIPFDKDEIIQSDGKTYKVAILIHDKFFNVKINNEKLSIPDRLYFNEPRQEKENQLTDTQKTILNCIYLIHNNGFIRQRRLEKLAENNQYWITPFIFKILGEYVIEILEVLEKQLDNNRLENYNLFVLENPKYWQQTESRIISYWNEYYRQLFPEFNDYLGKKIIDQIMGKLIEKGIYDKG